MEYVGLIFEIIFLAMGVYLYLFAIGLVRTRDPRAGKQAEAFRKKNGWWLRLLALALVALMLVNLYLHLVQLLG